MDDDRRRPRTVTFFVASGFPLLEYAAATTVFQAANEVSKRPAYLLRTACATTASPRSAPVGKHTMLAEPLPSAAPGRLDTLMVIGGETDALDADKLWLRRHARRARRIASFPAGTQLLAAAGVLEGAQVTTHWSSVHRLAPFAGVQARSDVVQLRDRHIWTCAGGSAAVEFALAFVEEDYGSGCAREVAGRLLTELRRSAEQGRFRPVDPVAAQDAETHDDPAQGRLGVLRAWIEQNLDADLAVPALAARANLSERSLHRAFAAETGASPAAYVSERRVAGARRRLVSTDAPLETIARECGFGTLRTFQRSFQSVVGMAPHRYRTAFSDRAPDDRQPTNDQERQP